MVTGCRMSGIVFISSEAVWYVGALSVIVLCVTNGSLICAAGEEPWGCASELVCTSGHVLDVNV